MECVMCGEDVDLIGDGLCNECKTIILGTLGVQVAYLDEEPYVEVKPQSKQPLVDFVDKLSELFADTNYNYHAIQHHSHTTKEVAVVDIQG